ncbi:MAG: site-specific integrase [Deltaproteobacteria bacterium]|nr:site-specific integrase [Deltaproteobacteria bacterium]
MAKQERIKTKYPGVFLVESVSPATGKPDQIIYIRYKVDGKLIEEKVGRTSVNAMSAAKANQLRSDRMAGKADPNTVRRAKEQAAKDAEAGRWTIAKLWNAYSAAKTLSVKRSQTDHSRFEKYLAKPFGNKEPHEIDAFSVHQLTKRLKDSGFSPATVWGVLELLRRIVNFGVKNGDCSPLGFKIDMPKVDNEKTEFMTPDQARAYFQALDEEVDQDAAAYFRIMLLTGIRKGALLALKWEDVDLEKGFLTLQGAVAKNGKTRTIPLSPGALTVLKGIARTDSPYVWPGRGGGPREAFRHMARRLRDKAGLPKSFRPCHGLRHHFASWLASSGQVDLYTLQNLLTHGSAAMTVRYAHLADDALKRAALVADSIMEAGQGGAVAINELTANGKE